jgi:RNA polymerase sigma-70 factor (ECF subfamily)
MSLNSIHITMKPTFRAAAGTPAPAADASSELQWLSDIYTATYRQLYSYCLRRLYIPEWAEDATAAAYLKLVERQQEFRDQEFLRVRNWLYGTARNAINASLKDKRRRKALAAELKPPGERQPRANSAQQDWAELYQSISLLKPIQQDIVILRYYQKLSFASIGSIVGISEAHARVQLSRALKALRQTLAAGPGEIQ